MISESLIKTWMVFIFFPINQVKSRRIRHIISVCFNSDRCTQQRQHSEDQQFCSHIISPAFFPQLFRSSSESLLVERHCSSWLDNCLLVAFHFLRCSLWRFVEKFVSVIHRSSQSFRYPYYLFTPWWRTQHWIYSSELLNLGFLTELWPWIVS